VKRKSNFDINFITDAGSLVKKVIAWISVYGIIFVVLTSVVLIAASSYHLYLDRRLTALDTAINDQLQAIKNLSDFENSFLTVQDKLQEYQDTLTNERMEDLLPKLTLVTPATVTINEMVINPNTVTISGLALSQSALASFINNIMLISTETFADGSQVEFNNLSVDSISNAQGNELGYNFAILFNYTFKSPL
jgi:Tfp pilus assembly protein PilN